MSNFRDFFVKEKPVFTGITRGVGGFGFGGAGGGAAAAPGPLGASGGNLADGLEPGNGFVYHTFGTSGSFVCVNTNEIEVLVVGGGGATSQFVGGGGGGGGICHSVDYEVTAGSHSITVGSGGVAAHPGPGSAGQGGDSYFGASGPTRLTGYGGGRSAKAPEGTFPFTDPNPDNNSQAGGSGAGGVRHAPGGWPGNVFPSSFYTGKATTQVNPLNQTAPGTATNYGSAGGNGGGAAPASLVAGGGGGAGGAGASYPGSTGGAGRQFPNFTGPLIGVTPLNPYNGYYGGGGGGARHVAGQGSNDGGDTSGGAGGGGQGGNGQPVRETDGVDYLGGGGGDGGGYEPKGSDGGSGIVVIRYPVAVK
jgi:hypothetical protein